VDQPDTDAAQVAELDCFQQQALIKSPQLGRSFLPTFCIFQQARQTPVALQQVLFAH
jgi:hypothetical protein